ncbi:MAG: glutathione S-transferase N-terminal domain-containing protein [Proteobacteria bacterium]|nr:glutathione S-transferase N-terminal domain-containing protein [Pseudomonadota bacterium]
MISLYELKGAGGRYYSLFSWRTRMALAHKGLAFESHPVPMSDKAAIAFSGGRTVPIIRDGEVVVRDSWKIAEHLEAAYPEAPSLFGGAIGHGLCHTFNVWADRTLVPAALPVVVADLFDRIDPVDRDFFRAMMEGFLKCKLEDTVAGRDKAIERLGRTLDPLRAVLKRQPFVCGAAPAYADYIVFSVFQWARVGTPVQLLAGDDPLAAWRERILDLHSAFARNVPVA